MNKYFLIFFLLTVQSLMGQDEMIYEDNGEVEVIMLDTTQYDSIYPPGGSEYGKLRHLFLRANVENGSAPLDPHIGFSFHVFAFEAEGRVLSFYGDQVRSFTLDPGKYKVVFSKLGFKSKMIEVEVLDYKSKDTPGYEMPLHIKLFPGYDKRELESLGKIFYNAKTDYYETEVYPLKP